MMDLAASRRRLPAAVRYGLAVVSVAAAASLATGPVGHLLFHEAPERFVHGVTLLYAAAIFSAWLGGRGPGLVAALLAVLIVDYFFTPPLYAITWDLDFLLRVAVFALSALLVGWLSARRRRMEDALRLSHDELELRVQERTADLTRSNEQLRAEIAARTRAEETLREQAALLDLTHDTVFARDENDVITYWNRGAEELYGWTKAEAVGAVSHALMKTALPRPSARNHGRADAHRTLGRRTRPHAARRHDRHRGEPLVLAACGFRAAPGHSRDQQRHHRAQAGRGRPAPSPGRARPRHPRDDPGRARRLHRS
jgi:PAS domain S-box-containing protein